MIKSYYKIILLTLLLSAGIFLTCFNLAGSINHYRYALGVLFTVLVGFIVASFKITIQDPYGSTNQKSLRFTQFLDGLTGNRLKAAVLVSAAISLLLELAMIRWQSSLFQFFAFHRNLSLLAAFGGLAMGYAVADKKCIPLSMMLAFLALHFTWMLGLRYGFTMNGANAAFTTGFFFSERYEMGQSLHPSAFQVFIQFGFTLSLFLFNYLIFMPVGQVCGRLLDRLPNLKGYGLNLLGSCAGVVAMVLLSLAWAPAGVWFLTAGVMIVVFFLWFDNAN